MLSLRGISLRVPWTARRSNRSIPKEINLEYSLEGFMLKLQYFGHLIQRTDSFEKTLMLGKIEGRRRRGPQRVRWLDGIIDWMDMSLSKLWEIEKVREAQCAVFHGVARSWTQLCDWTREIKKSFAPHDNTYTKYIPMLYTSLYNELVINYFL